MGRRCEGAGDGAGRRGKQRNGDGGAGVNGGETRIESYFPRIRKYRPGGRPAAEERRGLVMEDLIARRASSRNRSSKSNSFRNTRKKQGPTWTRGRQKVVGKETEWNKEKKR